MKPNDKSFAGVEFQDAHPAPQVGERIRERCTRDLAPARGLSRTMRWALTLAIVTASCVVLIVLRKPETLGAWHALPGVLGWAVALGLVSVFALLKPPGRRANRRLRWFAIGTALLSYFAYLGSSSDSVAPFVTGLLTKETWSCGVYAMLTGGLAAGLSMLPWRRTDPLSPQLTAAFLGLSGGVAAGLAAATVCPNHEAWHLCLGHGLALAVTVAAAARLGSRWLSP